MSVSGKNIIIDVTEDFAEQTKDEIRTWIHQLQAAMEIINEQATDILTTARGTNQTL